jgi:hypothetical protein
MNKTVTICLVIITAIALIGAGIWYKRDRDHRENNALLNQVNDEVMKVKQRGEQRQRLQVAYYDTATHPDNKALQQIWKDHGLMDK